MGSKVSFIHISRRTKRISSKDSLIKVLFRGIETLRENQFKVITTFSKVGHRVTLYMFVFYKQAVADVPQAWTRPG